MSRLLATQLRCLQDTREWSADEVYLLVAAFETQGLAQVRLMTVGDATDWTGLKAGGRDRERRVPIDPDWQATRLYLGALMERDGSADFDHEDAARAIRSELDLWYRTYASLQTVTRAELVAALAPIMAQAVKSARRDDEMIGDAVEIAAQPGESLVLRFGGVGARYELYVTVEP